MTVLEQWGIVQFELNINVEIKHWPMWNEGYFWGKTEKAKAEKKHSYVPNRDHREKKGKKDPGEPSQF